MSEFKPEIVQLKVSEIIPYPGNAKMHSPERVQKLAAAFEVFGVDQPIVLDQELVIIKGHRRLLAAQYNNYETMPCIIRTDMTDTEIKAARISDNQLTEGGSYDDDMLKVELQDILNKTAELDLSVNLFELTGFEADFMLPPEEATQPDKEEYSSADDPSEKKDYFLKVKCKTKEELDSLFIELTSNGYSVESE